MRKNLFYSLLFFLTVTLSVQAQTIKSPSEFLGYELGTRFTRHHAVVDYFVYVSKTLNNVQLEKYGETNEYRPLYISYISSAENIQNLETIREDNLKRAGVLEGNASTNIATVWLSYNVHGNEATSTEASMITLYNLVSNKQEWLKNTLVIIDPCMNPDGRDRYVNWYNQIKSTPYNTDPNDLEHNEPWPRGRANHYLFDLNRDWVWATQIETQQRLKIYNKWLPQVHVDFHEQGYKSPYYFAPAAEPFHEIITDWQRNFQTEIGKNHAKYFDKNGWRYFTKESFDLLYPSYGDTYPTYMGAIGMTYEQGGIDGGLGVELETKQILTLVDRIAHHVTTSISTVEMTSLYSSKLLSEFEKYFDNSKLADKSYILRGNSDKIKQVVSLLEKHEIKNYPAEEKSVKAYDYYSNSNKTIQTSVNDLVIPTDQPKGKMVKVLFEQETKLVDSVTYDITAWSIPYAYGLQGFASKSVIAANKNTTVAKQTNTVQTNGNKVYAYISKWNEISDVALLGNLLQNKINVRFSKNDFSIEGKNYKKGSLLILRDENLKIDNFDALVSKTSNNSNKEITAVYSGFVDAGTDFGSYNYALIPSKKVAIIAGEGTSSLSFGEIWHFFETQLKYPATIINSIDLNYTNLTKYDVLILPEDFNADKSELETFTSFTNNGGTIIAIGSAIDTFADKEGYSLKSKKDTLSQKSNLIPYDKSEREYIKKTITGSIFKSTIDNSHPLGFGYDNFYYSLKLSGSSYELLENGDNVGYFDKNSKNVSGFAGINALNKVPNSLLFGIERKGRGKIIYMVDNPLFRSFWQNGKLFFANAVFFN